LSNILFNYVYPLVFYFYRNRNEVGCEVLFIVLKNLRYQVILSENIKGK